MLRRLPVLAAVLALAGCGGSPPDGAGAERSSRLVDVSKEPPFVNSLVVTEDEQFLLTTNRGFFRISADGRTVDRIRGSVRAGDGSAPVGTFLEIEPFDDGTLMGSGHPDREGPLPPYLGFMRSADGGRTWRVVSRLGEADLHRMHRVHGRLYAFDAVLGAILTSEDEGETWAEHFTPRELVVDFVVDPEDEDRIVAATEQQLFRSPDRGDGWQPIGEGKSPRLDWPAPGVLMRADADGRFSVSADGGETWQDRGRIDGEPSKVRAVDAERAFVALSDGAILETTDQGRTFSARFLP